MWTANLKCKCEKCGHEYLIAACSEHKNFKDVSKNFKCVLCGAKMFPEKNAPKIYTDLSAKWYTAKENI